MLILSLDTSSPVASCAVCDGENVLASFRLNAGNTHSVSLMPMIKSALELSHIAVQDLDLIACAAGPGSFTGVRIGVSTAKGLCAPHDIPCVGVSTVEAFAEPFAAFSGAVAPVMNARRGNVYTAIFAAENGKIRRVTDDMIIPVADLCERLRALDMPVCFTGDAYDMAIAAANEAGIAAADVPPSMRLPDAASVAAVGARMYETGDRASFTAAALSPVYLRPGHMGSAPLEEK